jgi:hypothetical protein
MVALNSAPTVRAGLAAIGAVDANLAFAVSALYALANGMISATVNANAVTLAIKTAAGSDPTPITPVITSFRNASLPNGGPVLRQIDTGLSFTIPAGTLFFNNNESFRLWWCLFDNAGAGVVAVIRCRSNPTIIPLSEQGVASTSIIGGAPNVGTFYASVALSNKPYRILGYTEWLPNTLGTAGNFSALPDIVQLFGPGIKKPGDLVAVYGNTFPGQFNGASAANIIPYDTTVPQDTEGQSSLAYAFTPQSSANSVRFSASHNLARSTAGILITTLFMTGSANSRKTAAISAAADTPVTLNASVILPIVASGPLTFTARYGIDSAVPTLYLNSNSLGALFGSGFFESSLTLEELQG